VRPAGRVSQSQRCETSWWSESESQILRPAGRVGQRVRDVRPGGRVGQRVRE